MSAGDTALVHCTSVSPNKAYLSCGGPDDLWVWAYSHLGLASSKSNST